MSLKQIFSNKSVLKTSTYEIEKDIQSEGFIKEKTEDVQRIIPNVDFTTASNFAHFGSARKYYVDSFSHIYKTYPYDGSLKEKAKWRNESSFLDLYLFDNIYPKTTGYITLGSSSWNGAVGTVEYSYNGVSYSGSLFPQYVVVSGGPHADPINPNVFDEEKNKKSNFFLDYINGNTIEFWFKQEVDIPKTYCLFDLSDKDNVSRLTIENLNNNGFTVTYKSGSDGISRGLIPVNNLNIKDWHHYGFVFTNATCSLYIDGQYTTAITGASKITSEFSQLGLNATIGSYKLTPDGTTSANTHVSIGSGSVYASYDEFRFWKTARNAKQIYEFKNVHVGGGTNTDEYASDLGVYLKFNEGKIFDPAYDFLCLDYSGRISNGKIINYTNNIRSTSSAIEEGSIFIEEKDPIIFSNNSILSDMISFYENIGIVHDEQNTSNFYRSLPSWITEEADKNNDPELENFIQILSSYFDTLHLQIKEISGIKSTEYVSDKNKTLPFYKNALSSYGFDLEDIFSDATFLEEVLSRDEQTNFSSTLQELKNTIYKNIYNNISYIYKSKGTEKSFRNLLRCFGIDDELVKFNIYSNNSTYDITDKRIYTNIYKKFVDFNDPDRFDGSVFQKNVENEPDEKSYIDYSSLTPNSLFQYVPFTFETEVIFPKKSFTDVNYIDTPFTVVSLFGMHSAKSDGSDLSWNTGDYSNFQVYAIKPREGSEDAYFKLVSSGFNLATPIELTSSLHKKIYNNEKWNLSVRIKNEKDLSRNVGDITDTNYILEFYGVNSYLDEIKDSFLLTASIPYSSGVLGLADNKRIYAGSHYQDFNKNNILAKSDVKISSVRYWISYLSDEELNYHSYDASSYGTLYPSKNALQFTSSLSNYELPTVDSLVLNWDFSSVTSSDNNGDFIVLDTTSGSSAQAKYGVLDNLLKNKYKGYGTNFNSFDTQVVNMEYIYSSKPSLPAVLNGEDLISVVDPNDIQAEFTREPAPTDYFFSIEKSMNRIISDEMMKIFTSVLDFNNLMCTPLDGMRENNKELEFLNRKYFDTVKNSPDQEKFIEFYKWIDSSILSSLHNLIPFSANFSDNSSNMVENHILERNKIQIRSSLATEISRVYNDLISASATNTRHESYGANLNRRRP
jgi:hypothetical protein